MLSLHSSKKNDLLLRMNQYTRLFGTDSLKSKQFYEENIMKWKVQSIKDSNKNNNEKKNGSMKKDLSSDEELMILLSY